MSGYCDRCGNTMCVCSEYETQTADYGLEHDEEYRRVIVEALATLAGALEDYDDSYRNVSDARLREAQRLITRLIGLPPNDGSPAA
jgi:hypothetical protein